MARPKLQIEAGVRYNFLTTLREATREERPSPRHNYWLCVCDCGKEKFVSSTFLVSGEVKSCGCLRDKSIKDRATKHGEYGSLTYRRWAGMKARCNSDCMKPYYHQRHGITVCDRWRDSYQAFKEDMGECPTDKHTLDRIDGSKGYIQGNCRWATPKQQARNTKTNVVIDGVLGIELAEKHGISTSTLYARLRAGKTGEELVAPPRASTGCNDNNRLGTRKLTREQVIKIRERVSNGETYVDIAKDFPVDRLSISRIAKGQSYKDVN
jgi:hypothetical protein